MLLEAQGWVQIRKFILFFLLFLLYCFILFYFFDHTMWLAGS